MLGVRGDNFGSESRVHAVLEGLTIAELNGLCDCFEQIKRLAESHLETLGDGRGMDAFVEEQLATLEQRAGQNHHGGRAVTNFNVLGLGDLDQLLSV